MLRSLATIPAALLLLAAATSAQTIPQDLLLTPMAGDPLVTDSQRSRDVALADLDGDGDLDVIIANVDEPNALYRNDGSGNFSPISGSSFLAGNQNSRGLATGDVDGDGDVDVYVCNSKDQSNLFFLNSGGVQNGVAGDLVSVVGVPMVTPVTNSRKARFVDLDDDGDLDLFVANFNNEADDVFVNQGGVQGGTQGEFLPLGATDLTTENATSYDSAIGDFDNDGDLDIYVTHHDGLPPPTPGNLNSMFRNDGALGFSQVIVGPVTTDLGNSLTSEAGDVDGDGDIDLFVGNDEHNDNRLYLNNGGGAFSSVLGDMLVTDRGESIGSAMVDVDADGDLDVVTANRTGQYNVAYLQRPDGSFKRQSFGPFKQDQFESYDIELGDLDGNGSLDFVFANHGQVNLVYMSNGSQWADLGNGLANQTVAPVLSGMGNLLGGSVVRLAVEQGAANAPASLVVGLTTIMANFKGGVLVPTPDLLVAGLATNASGNLTLVGHAPNGLPPGLTLHFQSWISDAGGPRGYTASNALRATTP